MPAFSPTAVRMTHNFHLQVVLSFKEPYKVLWDQVVGMMKSGGEVHLKFSEGRDPESGQ